MMEQLLTSYGSWKVDKFLLLLYLTGIRIISIKEIVMKQLFARQKKFL